MRLRKSSLGMSLVELAIMTAIFAVIAVALTILVRQSQMVSFRALNQRDNLSQASQLAWVILNDFRSSSQTWLGNLQLNGDFETPQTPGGATPVFWPTVNPANGTVTHVSDPTLIKARSGQYALGLKATVSGVTTYISTNALTLRPGTAYMITGWAKTEGAGTTCKLSLVQASDDSEQKSDTANATGWTRLKFRYPDTGPYMAGDLVSDQAKIAVGVVSGTDQVYFDDLSVAPINAILVSSISSVAPTISGLVADVNDPADLPGFRFGRWEKGFLTLYRYRITPGTDPALMREKFNPKSDAWEKAWSQKLADNMVSLIFRYSSDGSMPSTGKESILEIEMVMRGNYGKRVNLNDQIFTFQVSPTAP